MPLVTVSNTNDPKGSVVNTPNFTGSNLPMASSSTIPVPVQTQPVNTELPKPGIVEIGVSPQGITEMSAPLPVPQIETPVIDVAQNLDQKIENINQMQNQMVNTALPVIQQPVISESLAQKMQKPAVMQTQQPTIMTQEQFPAIKDAGNLDITEILHIATKQGASDIHLSVGYRPMIRIDGKLQVAASAILTVNIMSQYVLELIKNRSDITINGIKEIDLTYSSDNRRFRVNISKQMGNFAITLRVIPDRILALEELGMPPIIKSLSDFPNGLVLITGPTGSGKSTTIASLLNLINITQPKHIITLEDPIEFVFPKGMGMVEQREFGIDFSSWTNALRSVLRQDPDVVLVGEMRDLETVEAALRIAETGHLVFATLHTNGAAESINRVIDIFDSQKQDQIRVQLSSVLRAVLSQKLVPLSSGGRKVATELLLSTPGVKNAIRDKKTFQIDNIIQTSSDIGMLSLEQSLVRLVKEGVVSKDVARSLSLNPNAIELLLNQ